MNVPIRAFYASSIYMLQQNKMNTISRATYTYLTLKGVHATSPNKMSLPL